MKWIRPAVAGVLAVALAVAGLNLGQRFAAPVEVPASEWVTAESVQPLLGSEPPTGDWAAQTALPESGSMVSVPLGSDAAAEAARLEGYLDAVSASDSPAAEAEELLPILELGGDPCALEGAAADCPAGIESTVLGIRSSAGLAVRVRSAAPPALGSTTCGAAPAGTVNLRVDTNRPASITVRYWTASGPERTATAETGDGAAAAWQSVFDTLGPHAKVPSVTTCVAIPGVTANSVYSAQVTASAPNGTIDQLSTAFNGSGSPVTPTATFFAPTDDLVVVIVPHLPGQTVESYVDVMAPGELGSCTFAPRGNDTTARHLGTDRHYTLTAEQVAAQNVKAEYTERTTIAYALNEGVTATVCVRVRSGDADPSYEASSIVHTADRLSPIVSIWGAAVWDGTEVRPTVRSYLANGTPCGSWTAPGSRERTWNESGDPLAYLCDFASLTGSAGATPERDGTGLLPYSFGTLGTFTVVWDDNDGDDRNAAFSLDLGSMARCTGSCALPADSYYRVGDDNSGLAVIRLSWTQGGSTGVTRTQFSHNSDQPWAAGSASPAYLNPSSAFGAITEDSWNFSYSRSLQLSANEEGSYSVQLLPAGPSRTLCTRAADAVTSVSGRLGAMGDEMTAWTSAEFTDLCYGEAYEAVVTLTTDAGATSVWRPTITASSNPWFNGRAAPVAADLPLTISYELHESNPEQNQVAGWFTLKVNGPVVLGPYEGYCIGENSIYTSEPQSVTVSAAGTLRITGELYSLFGTIDHGLCTGEFITALTDPQPFTAEVSLATLSAAGPAGIVIQVPRSGDGGLSVHWVSATIRVAIAS